MHALIDVNNIKLSYQPFQKTCETARSWTRGWGRGGVGSGVGGELRGDCGMSVRVSISKPTPFIYLAFENTDPLIY